MKQSLLKRFNTNHRKGYFLLPALVGLAVAAISVYAPAVSQASAASCTGLSGTFQTSTTSTTPYNIDGQNGSTTYHCVQDIQQMLSGALAYNRLRTNGTTSINSQSLDSVTSFGASYGGFGHTSRTYDSSTTNIQASFQKYINAYPTSLSSTTAIPKGVLRTDGKTDKNTMLALCTVVYNLPASAMTTTNSTDFTGGKPNSTASNKTNMWYMRSYMRAGYTAASSAGCASLIKTVPTTPPSTPASISNSITSPDLTVSWPAVSGATSYNVQILNTTGETLVHKATVKVTHAVFSVATTGATGTTEVQACNAVGCSTWLYQPAPFNFKSGQNR